MDGDDDGVDEDHPRRHPETVYWEDGQAGVRVLINVVMLVPRLGAEENL